MAVVASAAASVAELTNLVLDMVMAFSTTLRFLINVFFTVAAKTSLKMKVHHCTLSSGK